MRAARLSELSVLRDFRSRGPQRKCLPELVYGSAGARIFLLCLEPGQGLPLRRDSEEVVCYVTEGRVRLRGEQGDLQLSGGDLAGVSPGEQRGLVAEERAVVLWMQIADGGRTT